MSHLSNTNGDVMNDSELSGLVQPKVTLLEHRGDGSGSSTTSTLELTSLQISPSFSSDGVSNHENETPHVYNIQAVSRNSQYVQYSLNCKQTCFICLIVVICIVMMFLPVLLKMLL